MAPKFSNKDFKFLQKRTGLSHSQIEEVFYKFHENNPGIIKFLFFIFKYAPKIGIFLDGLLDKQEFAGLCLQLEKISDHGKALEELMSFFFDIFDVDNSGNSNFCLIKYIFSVN